MVKKGSVQKNSFWDSNKGDFFSLQKKRKKRELRIPSPKTTVIRGKVKEIIAKSPLEKIFEDHKILSLKIPFLKQTLKKKIPKILQKDLVQREKEQRIKKRRISNKLTLLIISSSEYLKNILVVLKYASMNYNKILYISLNELYDNLARNLKNNGIDMKNFYFIDAITRTAQTNIEEKKNCTFVTSPNALIELSLEISKKIDEFEPELIVFDSLSTLFIYEDESTAIKFVHSLIGKMKGAGCDSILTSLEGDAKRKAIKDLGMFVDEFLTMSEYQLQHFKIGVDATPVIPKKTPKEAALKKEMDILFPKRKDERSFHPSEKLLLLREMEALKNHLGEIKEASSVNDSLKRLERKTQKIKKKSPQIDASKMREEIVTLRKKAQEVMEKNVSSDRVMDKALVTLNSKILGIEKNLREKKFAANESVSSKEKQKLKEALKERKESAVQVEKLERKLRILEKGFNQGIISNAAFEKDKQKIEKLLKK